MKVDSKFLNNVLNNVVGYLIIFGMLIIAALFAFLLYRQSKKDARTVKIGFYFNSMLIAAFIGINVVIVSFLSNDLAGSILLFELFATAGLIILMTIITVGGMIINSFLLWKRESHTLGNLLVPIAFLGLGILLLLQLVEGFLPDYVSAFIAPLNTIGFYMSLLFFNYLVSAIIYPKLRKKDKMKDLVVLGGGLIGGDKVGKLLASRIKKGVEIFRINNANLLLMSGGQGRDEKVSEASAMEEYAVENKLIMSSKIKIEDKSKTTEENLIFSSKKIGNKFDFVTSEYHVFRAALLARRLDLKDVNGYGSKTPLYYRTTAFIREFIGWMSLSKVKHIGVVLIIIGFALINATPKISINWLVQVVSWGGIIISLIGLFLIIKKTRR